MRTTCLLFLLVPMCLSSAATAGVISIDSAAIYSRARLGDDSTDISLFTGTVATVSASVSAQEGTNQAETQINWSGSATSQSFGFEFSLHRDTTLFSFAKSDAFDLTFTANSDSSYELTGAFGSNAVDGTALFAASLLDLTTNTMLFENVQESRGTGIDPINFGLGGTDGNWGSVTVGGSLTGLLLAGHQYRLFYDALLQSVPQTAAVAGATGFLNLDIVAVPEPATLILLLIGLCGFIRENFSIA